ncbi:MAG: hypothetical protein JWQ89_1402 [Devosia sp.]|uniref:DUF2147 domain-containing protein n=1 Tax=Devosia sp. TaxID=1871048 RepID=UPI00262055DA|nr:DUF2147 domain-containing protein [Devosia sp.]MDB5539675.1 hypothetical protein [Devosia sp.]
MAWFRNSLRGAAIAAIAAVQFATVSAAAPPSPIEGVWLTTALTELTIAPCRDGYCGYISKIVVPEKYGAQIEAADPATFVDVNNKDPRLKNRPIQGLQILTLRPTRNPQYYEGEIYNPEDGNVYAGSIEVLQANLIRLKGCVLYVLCQEQEWARVRP